MPNNRFRNFVSSFSYQITKFRKSVRSHAHTWPGYRNTGYRLMIVIEYGSCYTAHTYSMLLIINRPTPFPNFLYFSYKLLFIHNSLFCERVKIIPIYNVIQLCFRYICQYSLPYSRCITNTCVSGTKKSSYRLMCFNLTNKSYFTFIKNSLYPVTTSWAFRV